MLDVSPGEVVKVSFLKKLVAIAKRKYSNQSCITLVIISITHNKYISAVVKMNVAILVVTNIFLSFDKSSSNRQLNIFP